MDHTLVHDNVINGVSGHCIIFPDTVKLVIFQFVLFSILVYVERET